MANGNMSGEMRQHVADMKEVHKKMHGGGNPQSNQMEGASRTPGTPVSGKTEFQHNKSPKKVPVPE